MLQHAQCTLTLGDSVVPQRALWQYFGSNLQSHGAALFTSPAGRQVLSCLSALRSAFSQSPFWQEVRVRGASCISLLLACQSPRPSCKMFSTHVCCAICFLDAHLSWLDILACCALLAFQEQGRKEHAGPHTPLRCPTRLACLGVLHQLAATARAICKFLPQLCLAQPEVLAHVSSSSLLHVYSILLSAASHAPSFGAQYVRLFPPADWPDHMQPCVCR